MVKFPNTTSAYYYQNEPEYYVYTLRIWWKVKDRQLNVLTFHSPRMMSASYPMQYVKIIVWLNYKYENTIKILYQGSNQNKYIPNRMYKFYVG